MRDFLLTACWAGWLALFASTPALQAQENGFASTQGASPTDSAAAASRLGGFSAVEPITAGPMMSTASYPEYRVGPHDVLGIWVYQGAEFTGPTRVSTKGEIRVPLCRAPIEVADLTPAEAEAAIAAALVDEGLLVDPIVTVEIREHFAKPVIVSGSVKNPTIFQAVGPVTLLEALGKAGGVTPAAGAKIIIERPATRSSPGMIQTISLLEVREGVNGAAETAIHGGEKIRVPAAPTAFVVGAGGSAGPIPLTADEGMEFFEFMARAGVQPNARHKKAIIFRPKVGGNGFDKDRIEVNLKQIVKFEVSSLMVRPADVVYFPESDGRAQGLLNSVIAGFVTQTAWQASFLLWR